jgi:hypothetical protein
MYCSYRMAIIVRDTYDWVPVIHFTFKLSCLNFIFVGRLRVFRIKEVFLEILLIIFIGVCYISVFPFLQSRCSR